MLHVLAETAAGTDIVGWLVFLAIGGVCGWVASILMKTNAQMGLVANIVVGIVGAMLAAWLLPKLGLSLGGGLLGGAIAAILGAVLLLFVLKLLGIFK